MNRDSRKTHMLMLLAVAVSMFGFAFALVALYNVFCEITGLNGKTSRQAALLQEIQTAPAANDRFVTVEFLASAARGLAWEFRPVDNQLTVQPGVMNHTTFYVRNRSSKTVTAQAVPSVTPGLAALHMKKIACFCFERQELSAGAEMEMGVSFVIDTGLPAEIRELTLSYTMFPVSEVDHVQMTGHQDQETD